MSSTCKERLVENLAEVLADEVVDEIDGEIDLDQLDDAIDNLGITDLIEKATTKIKETLAGAVLTNIRGRSIKIMFD